MIKLRWFVLVAMAVTLSAVATNVEMNDEMVVADVTPIGINFGGNRYYSPPKLKISYQENFEGTDYRQCHTGFLETNGFTTLYGKKRAVESWWKRNGFTSDFFSGAKVTVLSGPAEGQTATVKGVVFNDYDAYGKGAAPYLKFLFEESIQLPSSGGKAGILLQVDRRDEGCAGQTVGHWMGKGVSLSNDIDPEGFGRSCLSLDAGQGSAQFRTPTCWNRFLDNNGAWIVKFKAKAASGDAQLVLRSDPGGSETISLDDEWKTHEVKLDVSGFVSGSAERSSMVTFVFFAPSGKVLIDDIVSCKQEAFENPTVFRDDFVESLRALNPGILRKLMMGGSMRDYLEPPARSFRVSNTLGKPAGSLTGRAHLDYGAGEMLALAEELGAEAWFNIPGTLYPEEMDLFMEYLGGPVTTEGGKLRAEQGHPEPWTKTLKKIYVEPGNECWNNAAPFLASGYNGPDYWQELFTRVKESEYYSPNIICMAAGQNYMDWMSKQILADAPAADRYAIAPYQTHGLNASDLDIWLDVESVTTNGIAPDYVVTTNSVLNKQKFFRWAMAYPFHTLKHSMPKQAAVSKSTGVEFSLYEVNWHMTGGDIRANTKNHDPRLLESVNSFVASVPGAIGHFNHLLSLMRDYQIRSQCHFTFGGQYFEVKLWGAVLNYKKGEERMRPSGFALSMINKAIFGDMIGADVSDAPTFTATGLDIGGQKKKVGTTENPAITAYAFKDDECRSLILFNMDLNDAQTVTLGLPKGGTAKTQLLASTNYDDNNEFENGDPSVVIQNGTLELKDKMEITLPPASIMTLVW